MTACADKIRYQTRTKAMLVGLSRVRKGSPPLRAYRCPGCRKWHLTKIVTDVAAEGVVR